ncbi:MAG: leucine-rich repeat protein [Prevotella sp.]|nr:leucine-rich repeat protein [Prevotella sp.]
MKKFFTLFLFSMIAFNAIHADITWKISNDGTLTISGTNIPDYEEYYYAPWASQQVRIKKVVIEDGVTSIGNHAFGNCSSAISIAIPNTVASIGDYAFSHCSGLTSITIPESVKSIGDGAFSGCSELTSITIPSSVTSIGSYAFLECSLLAEITIPNSVKSIGYLAFDETEWYNNQPDGLVYVGLFLYRYKGVMPTNTRVEIKDGTKGIIGNAFRDCSILTSITIPNSVTSIGDYAFSGCSGLTSITIPNSVTSIGDGAFSGCSSLASIGIPNSVVSINPYTFSECSNLTSASIGNSIMEIGSYAFNKCYALTSINISNSVTSIGNYAFYGCAGITNISIPESITSIGNYAFYGCSGITSINLPNGVAYIGNSTFRDCSALKSISIPNSVNGIGKYAFSGSGIITITIPKSVTSIGEGAFSYSALTSVNIPNSVTNIESSTFNGCWHLTSATIGNSVTSIGRYAFNGCSGLKAITIPSSVTIIEQYAFSGCRSFTSITCEAIVPPGCASDCFSSKNIPLFVPINSINAYKTASQWRDFTNILEIPDNQKIADAVVDMINTIGKVEYNDACKGKIDAANKAYNALTADQKALVTNLEVLTKAQQTYETLKATAEKLAADKAKADPVIAKINAIGKVEYTYACKDKIDEANNAYNALTNDQKALVTNVDVLTTAKQTYDNLRAAAEKLIADKATFNKYKSEIIAIIEALVKDDDSDAVKEIIRKAIINIDALEYDIAITLDNNKANVQSFVTSVNEAVESQRAEDQKTNDIEELEFAEKVNIYDLNGRKTTNSMLNSGLYIRNGKKILVK